MSLTHCLCNMGKVRKVLESTSHKDSIWSEMAFYIRDAILPFLLWEFVGEGGIGKRYLPPINPIFKYV